MPSYRNQKTLNKRKISCRKLSVNISSRHAINTLASRGLTLFGDRLIRALARARREGRALCGRLTLTRIVTGVASAFLLLALLLGVLVEPIWALAHTWVRQMAWRLVY